MVQFVPLNISKHDIPPRQDWNEQPLFMHTNSLKYYPTEVLLSNQAFQLFQHTPKTVSNDAFLHVYYNEGGRYCIEFAKYELNGEKVKPVTRNFTDILPNFQQEYQLIMTKVVHLY